MAQQEAHYYFFIEAGSVVQQAENLLQAAPNVDRSSIEQSLAQLEALRITLYNFHDEQTTAEELQNLIQAVTELASRLTAIYDDPIENDMLQPETLASGPRGGRPALAIDLEVVLHLWEIGCKWVDIARVLGCTRQTLHNHLKRAGISVEQKTFTQISDYDLDMIVLAISREHPFIGSTIMKGHLESREIYVSLRRVKQSLKRVDPEAVLLRYFQILYFAICYTFEHFIRWTGIIRRRVYRVRGANALWHQDGNEKIRPWGFYVHGCIDGYSRMIVYLQCSSNKRAQTVTDCFTDAVCTFGWPSRVRGDYGKENNGIEREMNQNWGENHRAYL
jgi:hypothetical protein